MCNFVRCIYIAAPACFEFKIEGVTVGLMERALFRRRNVFARRLPHLLVFVYRRRENHSDLNAAAAPASTRQRRVAKEKSGHDNGETSMENRPKPEDTKTKDCASVEASKRVYTTTFANFYSLFIEATLRNIK
jgi:hypothetical protein